MLEPLGRDDLLLAPAGADPQAERFARQVAVTSAVFDVPSLVVLEDVHRADAASLQLLVHVAHEVSRRPALLTITFRPDPADHSPGFGAALDEISRAERVERLDLAGLDLPSVTHLLEPGTSPRSRGACWTSPTATRSWSVNWLATSRRAGCSTPSPGRSGTVCNAA